MRAYIHSLKIIIRNGLKVKIEGKERSEPIKDEEFLD
jgi:hypothetical protein